MDYFAFSYYRSSTYSNDTAVKVDTGGVVGKANPYLKYTSPEPWSWPVDPTGLRYVLNLLEDRYHLPLMIVENGIGLDEHLDPNGEVDDPFRVFYLNEHIKQVREAL